ncbi:hypothetical protein J5226_09465 [Lysobacter sp. K5869]|uniref:hypothetical protein n=1 Tax=Lysobacter sp. K5869 TaxID=2820808 RepID=UPI001C063C88|nr:hypothetical protein [Lysobacter sp. K5869]QWP78597.1 hypothetical protein J5226_09465 [Lysobacter sp. K5869]
MALSLLNRLFGQRAAEPALGALTHPLDLHAFTERYAQALRATWPQAQLRIGHGAQLADTRIDWSLPDGFADTRYVGHSYRRYLDAPGALEQVLAEQVAAARESQRRHARGAEAALDEAILPVLKTRGWHEVARQQARAIGGGARVAFVIEPLVGDLVLTFVEDRPDSMDYLSPAEAERRGLDRETLRECALRNLQRFLPELDVQGENGLYAARLDRNYDASMALLFEHWRARVPVRGEAVFALAARDELIVCDSQDRHGLSALRAMAQEISRDSAYGLSAQLFVHRGGALRVFEG